MALRTKDSYNTLIYQFAKDICVECPNCLKMAFVDTGGFHAFEKSTYTIKLVCVHCGYNKHLENVTHRLDPKQKKGNVVILGAPVDPFFHQPLWLQAEFEGNILWAYNLLHLAFLENHVSAKLRERNQHNFNVKSLGARLPRWMTSAKNREDVLKMINRLKEK